MLNYAFEEWQPHRVVEEWALVLEALAIPYQVEQKGQESRLLVDSLEKERAFQELSLYVEENKPKAEKIQRTPLVIPFFVPAALLFWHLLLSHFLPSGLWYDRGKIVGRAVMEAGEWWRAVTALTLHLHGLHLLSNLLLGSVVASALCSLAGRGLAWFLILLSGVLGNLWNVSLHHFSHQSVGASTAVFGALGLLGMVKVLGKGFDRRKFWLPFAGALAMLGFLGASGTQTDVGAHLFGFFSGLCLGLLVLVPVSYLGKPGRLIQAVLALASWALVLYAWMLSGRPG